MAREKFKGLHKKSSQVPAETLPALQEDENADCGNGMPEATTAMHIRKKSPGETARSEPIKCTWVLSLKEVRAEADAHFSTRCERRALAEASQVVRDWREEVEGKTLTDREAALFEMTDEELIQLFLRAKAEEEAHVAATRRSARIEMAQVQTELID